MKKVEQLKNDYDLKVLVSSQRGRTIYVYRNDQFIVEVDDCVFRLYDIDYKFMEVFPDNEMFNDYMFEKYDIQIELIED